jgi:L,D-peptidoglycan transpeptidase YkuD (ErfK/YbiS/YcfS/YnhG family)
MDVEVSADGTLKYSDKVIRCALGRTGIRREKIESDGATPSGNFPFRRVLFRPDRIPKPETILPIQAIGPTDGWCDDPADPKYNMPVTMPFPASAESLWRQDGLYDVIVVLGHNDTPPIPGAGSAIFLHVARPDFGPTEGCVALPLTNLCELLMNCQGNDWIRISALPAHQK